MKKFVYPGLGLLLIIVVVIKLFVFSSSETIDNNQAYKNAFVRNYKIFSVEIPDKVSFAGEDVPLEKYYVREGLDRELMSNTYWHSNTLLLFKRAYRWFPVIEPILKANNIPDDFKYVALIESSLSNAISPKGAAGFWQFMKKTGPLYGLEVSSEIDERYNIEKSTDAACKYLLDSYKSYKNWTLSAASYNTGKGRIDKELKEQKANNYYDLYLNSETSRYIFRILAIKLIYTNPTKYGFYLREKDFYPPIPTRVVTVDSSINSLADFAIEQGINYRILKYFNPWLRSRKLVNKNKKTYDIKIPVVGYTNYSTLLKDLDDSGKIFHDTIRIKQIR